MHDTTKITIELINLVLDTDNQKTPKPAMHDKQADVQEKRRNENNSQLSKLANHNKPPLYIMLY